MQQTGISLIVHVRLAAGFEYWLVQFPGNYLNKVGNLSEIINSHLIKINSFTFQVIARPISGYYSVDEWFLIWSFCER